MLQLKDRLTGEIRQISAGEEIHSGRFELTRSCQLGFHGTWPAGTLLVDDGRRHIEVNEHQIVFVSDAPSVESIAERAIQFLALEEISKKGSIQTLDNLPSPVIPAEISHSFECSDLESGLQETLQKGHLHHISRAPRMSMRYDEVLLDVSRVKRTASNYQRHLAAHSECWQQRTFTGIVPKQLMAKISEDEIHIYENRVYARFLDHTETFVLNKLAELRVLSDTLLQGLALEGSQKLHRSLSHSLCKVWGESFEEGEAEKLKELSEQQIKAYSDILRKVRQLKQSTTYRAVPLDAQVPLELKNTNILCNDEHYIKLRELWRLWLKECGTRAKSPVDTFLKRQQESSDYERYIGLLLIRSHLELSWSVQNLKENCWSLNHPSGVKGTLSLNKGVWIINVTKPSKEEKSLVFVPFGAACEGEKLPILSNDRIGCVIKTGSDQSGYLSLSPKDLYSEEKVIIEIQRWWWHQAVEGYGKNVIKLPAAIQDRWPSRQPVGCFKRMPDAEDKAFLCGLEARNTRKELIASIEQRYLSAQFVSFCPCCGKQARETDFHAREGVAFTAFCTVCSASWQMRSTGSEWMFEIGDDKSESTEAGRWHWITELNGSKELSLM